MNKPVKTMNIGTCSAAIWANRRDGRVYYSAKFERGYKQEGDWKSTQYFSRDDLLNLSKLADMVHTWIMRAIERDRADAPVHAETPANEQSEIEDEEYIPF